MKGTTVIKKVLEHPDKDEIISKLVLGIHVKEIAAWLDEKYTVVDTRFVLSDKFLINFKDNYLDIYTHIREDIIDAKKKLSPDDELVVSLKNNKSYKQVVEQELDIKKTVTRLVAVIEARAEQVFDRIQQHPDGFRGDMILINWFNLLLNTLEKANKIVNEAPDQIIQHNVAIQQVDSHVNIIIDSIRDILSKIDIETSLHFIDLINEKMSLLKEPVQHLEIRPTEVRLAEAKLLSETIIQKSPNIDG